MRGDNLQEAKFFTASVGWSFALALPALILAWLAEGILIAHDAVAAGQLTFRAGIVLALAMLAIAAPKFYFAHKSWTALNRFLIGK